MPTAGWRTRAEDLVRVEPGAVPGSIFFVWWFKDIHLLYVFYNTYLEGVENCFEPTL